MSNIIELKKPASRLKPKKPIQKKSVLEVKISVDINNLPEDCERVKLLCNLFGHPVLIEITSLKKFFDSGEKDGICGMFPIYKTLVSKTFEEHLEDEKKVLGVDRLEDLFEDDPLGHFKRVYGSIEGYMERSGLMEPKYHLLKITKRSIYMILKQLYPFFQDFSFKTVDEKEIVEVGVEASADRGVLFDHLK